MVFGKYFKGAIVFLILNLLCVKVFATDPSLLDPDDVVFKTGWFGVADVKKVKVVRINIDSNKVKIRDLQTGVTEWVYADKLYTKDELNSKRWKTAGKLIVGIDQGFKQAQTDKITELLKADGGFSLLLSVKAMSLGMEEYPFHAICKCLASNIVKGESGEVIKLIEKDVDNIDLIGEKKIDEYFTPCIDKYFKEERPVVPPGYVNDDKNRRKKWKAGLKHPQMPNITSIEKETYWIPDPGYELVDPKKNLQVIWKPGLKHPQMPNITSVEKETYWIPDPGYEFVDPKKNLQVIWKSGLKHPQMPNITSVEKETYWIPDPGYEFVDPKKNLQVIWKSGLKHPQITNITSSVEEGNWNSEAGYVFIDSSKSLKVVWRPRIKHPLWGSEYMASQKEGYWITSLGDEVSSSNIWSSKFNLFTAPVEK